MSANVYIGKPLYFGGYKRVVIYKHPMFKGKEFVYVKRDNNIIKIRPNKEEKGFKRKPIYKSQNKEILYLYVPAKVKDVRLVDVPAKNGEFGIDVYLEY